MHRHALTMLLLVSAAWAGEDRLQERVEQLERRLAIRESKDIRKSIEAYLAASEPEGDAGGHDHEAPFHLGFSAHILVGLGTSTANNDELLALQGGGHDPRRRGFTFQQLELSAEGELPGYFRAEIDVILLIDPVEGETRVELEEAFAQSVRFGGGFQVEVGHFFTEFGSHNPLHPHEWDFVDVPIVLTRMFGEDGLRSTGMRVSWQSGAIEIHFGVQNAEGETAVSFFAGEEAADERSFGGRPFVEGSVRSLGDLLYLARVEVSRDALRAGISALFGPNYTGPDGWTAVYGADVRVTLGDVLLSAEFVGRSFHAAAGGGFAEETFFDWGAYVQGVVRLASGWAVGARVGFAAGDGDAAGDPFRDDRLRASFLAAYTVSEHLRVRMQLNYERADFLPDRDHFSVWLVIEIGLGEHEHH